MNIPDQPIAMSHEVHTYIELRQQIHHDLRIQHPEWVEPNGESSMCLLELLDSLTVKGIQRVYRCTPRALDFCAAELVPKVRAGQFSPNQIQLQRAEFRPQA